ncbi:MAG: hypothetical protein ACYTGZ_16270 [Planctomycetota bacterium]|jgi:hypothetical protein
MKMALLFSAAAQAAIACLNLGLPRLLGWRSVLAGVPTLLREVYYVHAFYLSVTLFYFAGFTLFFGDAMLAGESLARAVARGIGVFWAIRVGIQFFYYSPNLWRGKGPQTLAHVVLAVLYSFMAGLYLMV